MFLKSLLFCVALALALGVTTKALAQIPDTSGPSEKVYVSGNIFAYFESADGDLNGSTYGGGASFGYFLRPKWSFGAEVSIPAFFTDDDGEIAVQHRDTSVAALFGWHPWRGTTTDISLLVGLTYLRVETRTESFVETPDNVGAVAVGFDWRIPVSGKFAVVPQARAHVTTGAFVFRAGVGFQVDF